MLVVARIHFFSLTRCGIHPGGIYPGHGIRVRDSTDPSSSPLTPHPSLFFPFSLLPPPSFLLPLSSSLLTPHLSPLPPPSSLVPRPSSLLSAHPSFLTPHSSHLTPHPSLPPSQWLNVDKHHVPVTAAGVFVSLTTAIYFPSIELVRRQYRAPYKYPAPLPATYTTSYHNLNCFVITNLPSAYVTVIIDTPSIYGRCSVFLGPPSLSIYGRCSVFLGPPPPSPSPF